MLSDKEGEDGDCFDQSRNVKPTTEVRLYVWRRELFGEMGEEREKSK